MIDIWKLLADTSSTFQSQLMVNVPITICTAQLQGRSALCFISLIKSLNFAGLLEYIAVISSIFQSLLKVDIPVTICTAQLQARSALCFVSLLKSLNLNLAGLLEYFAAHHWRPNLKPKSFTCPLAACTVLLAGTSAAGDSEQTADSGGSESGEADPSKSPAPAAPRCPGTDEGAAKQQWINLPVL